MSEASQVVPPRPRRRPHRIHVRMTPEEFDHLREQAQILNRRPASYTRALILGEALKPVPRFPPEVHRAIKSLGPNLNQLAHAANRGAIEKGEVEKLRQSVVALLEALGAA